MATSKRIIAAPTSRIVSVCPSPQSAPIHPARASEGSRLIIVENRDYMVRVRAWRILPEKKPIASMVSPLSIN